MGKRVPPGEDAVWAEAVRDVVKLGDKAPLTPKTPKMPAPTGASLKEADPEARVAAATRWRQAPIPVLANQPERLAGCATEVPAKTFKRLAQGELRPQAVLDLHGWREGDAWLRLHAFLQEAQGAEVFEDGRMVAVRMVLIIHGKGRGHGPTGTMGVLKSQMAAWLAAHPAVLAFHTALPRDGGQGAVYVLLRQRF